MQRKKSVFFSRLGGGATHKKKRKTDASVVIGATELRLRGGGGAASAAKAAGIPSVRWSYTNIGSQAKALADDGKGDLLFDLIAIGVVELLKLQHQPAVVVAARPSPAPTSPAFSSRSARGDQDLGDPRILRRRVLPKETSGSHPEPRSKAPGAFDPGRGGERRRRPPPPPLRL